MNLIQTRCSVCTAPLEIAADALRAKCTYCATSFTIERRGRTVTLQLADSIEEHAAQTRAVILEEADATQSELRRLQLTQQYSHTQLHLANVQREIRAVERAPQSAVTRPQLAELRAQEAGLKTELAALERELNPQPASHSVESVTRSDEPFEWMWLLFSFTGRISRARFWLGMLVFVPIYLMAGPILITFSERGNLWAWLRYPAMGLLLVALWIGLALAVKRLHDRGKAGWWVAIVFIPVIGPLWLLVEAGFLPSATDV